MSILQEINTDLKQAMREQDVLTRDTLRMLVAEIKRYEIDNKTSANEEDILKIIKKMLKQRKDSIEQFTAGNRQDLADKEKAEIRVIDKYMPELMSEDAIKEIVTKVIADSGANGPQDMGKVMGQIKSALSGPADMGLVSKLVKEQLS